MAKQKNMIGSWAFLVGVILAIIIALLPSSDAYIGAFWLVIIGIVVGALNVAEDETDKFLMSGVILIIVSALGQGALSTVPIFQRALGALLIIFVPATIIVAIKNVFTIARR